MSENRLNWFPGHMAKSFRQLKSELGRVHLIIECRDARIPQTSANPKIDELIGQRERLILLTKSDLVSKEALEEWLNHFKEQGIKAAAINLKGRSAKRAVRCNCV